jgi:hypothetical protein
MKPRLFSTGLFKGFLFEFNDIDLTAYPGDKSRKITHYTCNSEQGSCENVIRINAQTPNRPIIFPDDSRTVTDLAYKLLTQEYCGSFQRVYISNVSMKINGIPKETLEKEYGRMLDESGAHLSESDTAEFLDTIPSFEDFLYEKIRNAEKITLSFGGEWFFVEFSNKPYKPDKSQILEFRCHHEHQ